MADYKVSDSSLTSVADAIRTKGGTSAALSFPDGFVTAIGNISTGGGSTLITKNIVANGTYNASSDSADGYSSVTVAVPSKLVTGTFTGTTGSSATDITIPYTGSGYPVAVIIYPSLGTNKTGTTWYNTVLNRSVGLWAMVKSEIDTTPSYNNAGTNDQDYVLTLYKYSDSDASVTTSNRVANNGNYRNINASHTYGECVFFKSATTMSVYITDTSGTYGFQKDVEYTYQIIYSA